MDRTEKTERRFVRSDDPTLSDEANAQLSGEVRRVVGRDEVRVPARRPDPARGRHGGHSPIVSNVAGSRIGYVMAAAAGVVAVLAVLAFVTESIALVAVAFVVLLVMLGLVIRSVMHVAGDMEHPDPDVAARLEEEGVRDPDGLLDDLVQSYTDPGAKAERQKPPPDRH